MKWMGWSWEQLRSCPAPLLSVIGEMMQEEAREHDRLRRKR